jgi:hypothetical protein
MNDSSPPNSAQPTGFAPTRETGAAHGRVSHVAIVRCGVIEGVKTEKGAGVATMTAAAIESLRARANVDTWLVHRGRFLDTTFLLEIGTDQYLICIHRGRLEGIQRGPLVMPRWTFALRAPAEAWAAFWKPVPPPGYNDLIGMMKMRALRIEGDQHPFVANLRYFKDLLALPRTSSGGGR